MKITQRTRKFLLYIPIVIFIFLLFWNYQHQDGFFIGLSNQASNNLPPSNNYLNSKTTLTYQNTKYGFSFKYPVDSVLYSEIKDNGTVMPPTDNEVCVSDGKIPPMQTNPDGNVNDDPDMFCVSVYPNTTLDNYLKINDNTSLAQIDKDNSDDLGDIIYSRVKVQGATVALYAIDRMMVLMQKGRDLVVFSGSYFDYFIHFDKDPWTFSDLGFMSFILSATTTHSF